MPPDNIESRRESILNDKTSELTVNSFKMFLKSIEIFDFKQNKNEVLLNKILEISTPMESMKPILTSRNIRATFYAILNYHEDWMSNQDPKEQQSKEQTYQRKIWKYKMMLCKLNSDSIEALIQSSKSNNDFLENISAK